MKSWVDKCLALRKPKATLGDMLNVAVHIDPQKVALIFKDQNITYNQLDIAASKVANGLIELGVQKGDRVAIQVDNRPEFLMIYIGAMRIGAILVPANVMYKSQELHHILQDSGARVLFISAELSSKMDEIRDSLPELVHIIEVGQPAIKDTISFESFISRAGIRRPSISVDPNDYAIIQYTSGTTGKPKGAIVSHNNVISALDMVATLPKYPLHDKSVGLLVLPLFHSFGLDLVTGLLFNFGATMILVNRFDAENIFALFEKHRVTLFWGAPPMFHAFVNTAGLERYDVSSLEHILTGAAPLPPVVFERFKQLTGVELSDGYGLSETSPTFTLNTIGPVNKIGSVGPVYPQMKVKIVDEKDNPVPQGEVGEICAQGPNVFHGYWKLEDDTAQAMKGGWFHTGDMGRMDEDGYVYIVDRKKDMIVVSGYNVYPLEVENTLLEHPSVLDCAIVGVEDEYQGESVKAFVVPHQGQQMTEQEVIDYLKQRLASFKCPKHVAFVGELPKSPSGKVLKRVLRDMD